ncbi:hypothetical protein JOL79_23935 [Microbispora sp. RL4-1S]|uniref:Uncharacterized protein n=1 Tax=Microbispora oryzae TaxID=2806554 RepID=A0A940WN20_9ACTN|nr:hypothetical protein [Microbispora oryzae]MBP2706862.1 hypothetical protein [Microbispora oryzae]
MPICSAVLTAALLSGPAAAAPSEPPPAVPKAAAKKIDSTPAGAADRPLATLPLKPALPPRPHEAVQPEIAPAPEKPATRPVIKPIAEHVAKPVTMPITKPAAMPVIKPITKPITKPAAMPVTKPVTKPALDLPQVSGAAQAGNVPQVAAPVMPAQAVGGQNAAVAQKAPGGTPAKTRTTGDALASMFDPRTHDLLIDPALSGTTSGVPLKPFVLHSGDGVQVAKVYPVFTKTRHRAVAHHVKRPAKPGR